MIKRYITWDGFAYEVNEESFEIEKTGYEEEIYALLCNGYCLCLGSPDFISDQIRTALKSQDEMLEFKNERLRELKEMEKCK